MGNVYDDAVRDYAGMSPNDVIGRCLRDNKPFGDVERAYCSQYFSEKLALIEADAELFNSMGSDPVLEGINEKDGIPAYAQERHDMYANIDTDFAGRTADVLDEFTEAHLLLRNAESSPGKFSKEGLVDKQTLDLLHRNGLAYSVTIGPEMKPSSIVLANLADGNKKLNWQDAYECNVYLENHMSQYDKTHSDSDKKALDDAVEDVNVAQQLFRDATEPGVGVFSVLSYRTIQQARTLGYELDVKNLSAEGLYDIYEIDPQSMVRCAEEAGIRWDSGMQARMDQWISDEVNDASKEQKYRDYGVKEVISAESLAAASNSSLFERQVPDGVFNNGSLVKLYSQSGEKVLKDNGYDRISKEVFGERLDEMRARHVTGKQDVVSQGDRTIKNVPDFEDKDVPESSGEYH